MKKKYLALLLSCFMMAPMFLSSCGRLTDEIVRDEDEEEEENSDDDEDEEEDDGPVFVDVLDDEDLEDQIKLIVKKRSEWEAETSSSAVVEAIHYLVTDLDHNGRLEIIAVSDFEYGELTQVSLFEVDEKGKALEEAKWKWKGLELSSDQYPDFPTEYSIYSYYDKKKEITRYLLDNSFDNGNNEYGYIACDVKYSEGKVECLNYAAAVMEDDWGFYADDETAIETADDFDDYLSHYPKNTKTEELEFGVFTEGYGNGEGLLAISDEELTDILTDSYRVFSGEMGSGDYDLIYNSSRKPEDEGILYDDLIGRWILYSADDGYDQDYYSEESSEYMTFVFYDDHTALMTIYLEGEVFLESLLDVDVEDPSYPLMNYYDTEHEYTDENIDYIQYIVLGLGDDKQDLNMYCVSYDTDGFIEEGYNLTFYKDKYFNPTYEDDYYRAVGEWGLYSSELEGDITYYTEDGYRYVTLSVYDDFTVSMKEYENGKVYLTIDAPVFINDWGSPAFEYSEEESLNDVVGYELYSFNSISSDNNTLEISIDFYGHDGDWLGYTILTFERI